MLALPKNDRLRLHLPIIIKQGVGHNESPRRCQQRRKGPHGFKNLCSITPQEEILAPYFALANNIKPGLCDSDITAWITFFRATLFTYKVMRDPDAKEFATIRLRQEAAAKYFAVAYTPIQWIYKIVQK